jgi:hypothetical protein
MDRRTELEQHLTWLDAALEDAPPAAVAALVRERRITVREIAEVPKSDGKSIRDDVAAKRAARRSAAQAAQASTGRRHHSG